MPTTTIVWYRQDLRTHDHAALTEAAARGPVVPVFIWAPDEEGDWPPGAASRWYLHHSLAALDDDLRSRGAHLILRRGPTAETLRELARDAAADAVYFTRRYEPAALERDRKLVATLKQDGIACKPFGGALLWEPEDVKSGSGAPYRVYTPFWNHVSSMPAPHEPLPAPKKLQTPSKVKSLELAALDLLPRIDWAGGLRRTWQPGSAGALKRLKDFEKRVGDYKDLRDRPDLDITSHLSPHLHWGEITAATVWHRIRAHLGQGGDKGVSAFLRQLAWREFGYHLLTHYPHTPDKPLRPEFRAFPWRRAPRQRRAWQRGQTGYPIVDAGMRQLWAIGWMHNRLRLIVASFLVKDQLIPWQTGARWFWDTLCGADLANNTLGWQWVAGSGADAAPYFRIFNPVTQGRRFDPDGNYVRRWVPELADVPNQYIHEPWAAPQDVLAQAGVKLGRDYPKPVVEHSQARQKALEGFEQMRRKRGRK